MTTTSYLLIKTERARKTGEGSITYAVLKDADSQGVYFTLLANDGAGQFSPEIVAFEKIEQCLTKVDGNKPVPAKLFAPAFVGRSANNAGFLMAAMRQELLLLPTVDASHLHAVSGNWNEWKRKILAQEGQPYTPPAPKGKGVFASTTPADTQAKPQPVVHDNPKPEADSAAPKGKKSRKLLMPDKKPAETAADAVDPAEGDSIDTEAIHHDDAA